jgi:hypothetical protein
MARRDLRKCNLDEATQRCLSEQQRQAKAELQRLGRGPATLKKLYQKVTKDLECLRSRELVALKRDEQQNKQVPARPSTNTRPALSDADEDILCYLAKAVRPVSQKKVSAETKVGYDHTRRRISKKLRPQNLVTNEGQGLVITQAGRKAIS